MFPRKRKSFKDKSSIPQSSALRLFIFDLMPPVHWFGDNARVLNEYGGRFSLIGMSRLAYDSLFNALVWFVPALRPNTIDNAIFVAANQLAQELPLDSKVAVLSFASADSELGEFILEEMVGYLSSVGTMHLVDRVSLESIRREHDFQMTTEVDYGTAISIGQFAGADVVITGSVTGSGPTRRLRFIALDVRTARILSQTSNPF